VSINYSGTHQHQIQQSFFSSIATVVICAESNALIKDGEVLTDATQASYRPFRTQHAVPMPRHLPCYGSAVSFVKVRMVAGNIRTASPTVQKIVFFVVCCYHSLQSQVRNVVRRIGMLLITIFVEIRVVAGRSRTWTGSPQAVSRRTCCTVALRTALSEHGMGAAWAWHGKCESDTAALCKSNGKDILNP